MVMDSLRMPPFNTTLMGVLRGVLDYHGLGPSDALLYGGSGHAFLMNIHEELCPSGPYCWKMSPFRELVRNLGVEMTDLGFFSKESDAPARAAIEGRVRELVEAGVPCSLLNMEHQLITGWDETGFLSAQPWAPRVSFPPGHLAFGTWAELGDEVHVSFFSFRKVEPACEAAVVAGGLRHAVDLHRRPFRHTDKPYAVGAQAYAAWIAAVEKGHGASHGNWWNGTVWSECRHQASELFSQIAASYPGVERSALELAADYKAIAEALAKASDKALASGEKVRLLREAAAREAGSLAAIGSIAAALD
jgi:hypothetical protein